MESASWQRPLYGFEISQNQAKMPLKSGFSDGLGGVFSLCNKFIFSVFFIYYSLLSILHIQFLPKAYCDQTVKAMDSVLLPSHDL